MLHQAQIKCIFTRIQKSLKKNSKEILANVTGFTITLQNLVLAGRDAVIAALPPLRLANSKHTPVQTGGQSVEPLSEDMWEKLEE